MTSPMGHCREELALKLARLIPVFLVPLMLVGSGALAANGDCRLIRGADTPLDPTDDVSVCRQDVWVHASDSKVGNLAEGFATFNTTKPTASYTTGAGAAFVANEFTQIVLAPDDPTHTLRMTGTFTGHIDNLAAEVYLLTPSGQAFSEYGLIATLTIDGTNLYTSDFVEGNSANMTPAGDVAYKFKVAFTNLYEAMLSNGIDGSGTHTVDLGVAPYFFGDDAIYVYDAAEIPTGIIFNLEKSALGTYSEIQLQTEA